MCACVHMCVPVCVTGVVWWESCEQVCACDGLVALLYTYGGSCECAHMGISWAHVCVYTCDRDPAP